MAVRIAISGFGRIGRNILRAIVEAKRKDLEIVAINDLFSAKDNAHLLRYDSVHGRFPGTVTVAGDRSTSAAGRLRCWPSVIPTSFPGNPCISTW